MNVAFVTRKIRISSCNGELNVLLGYSKCRRRIQFMDS